MYSNIGQVFVKRPPTHVKAHPPAPAARFMLLGCPIDNLSLHEVLAEIEGFIQDRVPRQHVAINVHKVVQAHRDPELRNILNQCALSCADGQPLVWLSKLRKQPLKARLAGIDLMNHLLAVAAEKQYRVFFLGAREEVVSTVVERCKSRYLGLQVAGFRHGYWRRDAEQEVVDQVHEAKPDILFVALSSPQKEFFVHRYLHGLGVPFVLAVGGSFDVIAGKTIRAPQWMQRAGLEWLWRVLQEPRRMAWRYFLDGAVFCYLVLREFLRTNY